MTTRNRRQHHDVEQLCEDVPIGRFGLTWFVSLDIALVHRDTAQWGGAVYWRPDPTGSRVRFRGQFRELLVQHRIRRFLPFLPPRSFGPGCPVSTWSANPGWRNRVFMADLQRLEVLVEQHQARLRLATDSAGQPVPGESEVEFIPAEIEEEIRSIGDRLVLLGSRLSERR